MSKSRLASLAIAAGLIVAGAPAMADCLNKAAEATAGSEASAKWYAKETMVQAVSWNLWPAFLADGSVPGYTVKNETYKCSSNGGNVTCRGQATFCKK